MSDEDARALFVVIEGLSRTLVRVTERLAALELEHAGLAKGVRRIATYQGVLHELDKKE